MGDMKKSKPSSRNLQTDAIYEAIGNAGGQVALSKVLGLRQQTISAWATKGRIPPEHVLRVEKACRVSRHRLRPDIYPVERIRTLNRAAAAT